MIPIPDETLRSLAETVHQHLGLNFPRERWPDLVRGVEATCSDLGLPGQEACTRALLSSPLDKKLVETLGRHLTIGETYFFREPAVFRALETGYLPSLLESRRSSRLLRLWSAACSTGEEPYSLAILLRKLLPDPQEWKITILATDINTASLSRAEAGIYREWSFRGVEEDVRNTWFIRTPEGHFQVRPEIRAMVTFAYHNLVADPYPSLINQTNAMDVIFCRNVLMYFSEAMRRKVMDNLELCLVDGGLLAVGGAEATLSPPESLIALRLPEAHLYRKSSVNRSLTSASPPLSSLPMTAPPARASTSRQKESVTPITPEFLPELKAAYRRGDYEAVCRGAASLKKDEAARPEAALMAAKSCANAGNLDSALAWVGQAITLDRTNPDSHYLRAMILDEKRETAQALDALRTTVYLDPDFIPAFVALGNIFRRQGDRVNAQRNFRNALILLEAFEDDDPVPHSEEMRAGRLREAVMTAMGGPDGQQG